MLGSFTKQASTRLKTQVIEVVEVKKGVKVWMSDVVGWGPHDTIEMQSKHFSVGTKITIEYARETVQAKAAIAEND